MWLHQAFAWLSVLALAGGAVVSGLNLGRSRWAGFLMAAFVAEAIVMAYFQVALVLMTRGVVGATSFGAVSLLGNLVSLAARVCIVRGLAGLFSELARPSPPAATGPAGA